MGNEKIAPETSVPRGLPLRCPSTGPQKIVHICTSEHHRSRFYSVSESSAALLRGSVLGEFLFRFPLSGVDAARGIAITRLVSSRGPYRTASITDEQHNFTLLVGQLIIDGLLTRWQRQKPSELYVRIDLCFSFDSHYQLRRQYWISPGALSSRLSIWLRRVRPPDGLPIDNR